MRQFRARLPSGFRTLPGHPRKAFCNAMLRFPKTGSASPYKNSCPALLRCLPLAWHRKSSMDVNMKINAFILLLMTVIVATAAETQPAAPRPVTPPGTTRPAPGTTPPAPGTTPPAVNLPSKLPPGWTTLPLRWTNLPAMWWTNSPPAWWTNHPPIRNAFRGGRDFSPGWTNLPPGWQNPPLMWWTNSQPVWTNLSRTLPQ